MKTKGTNLMALFKSEGILNFKQLVYFTALKISIILITEM
jgi:hypothetical protein